MTRSRRHDSMGWHRKRCRARSCDIIRFAVRVLLAEDLKPSNILVEVPQRPKLLDFGLSHVPAPCKRASRQPRASWAASAGEPGEKYISMAAEQAAKSHEVEQAEPDLPDLPDLLDLPDLPDLRACRACRANVDRIPEALTRQVRHTGGGPPSSHRVVSVSRRQPHPHVLPL